MGLVLHDSRHGIHVSACFVPMDRGSIDDAASQNFRLLIHLTKKGYQVSLPFTSDRVRVTFTPQRPQLYLDVKRNMPLQKKHMATKYECTSPLMVVLEIAVKYDT